MLQRKRSASENECHTSHSVSHTAERGDENMRSTVWLFPLRFYRRPRAPSSNSAGRWKKNRGETKKYFLLDPVFEAIYFFRRFLFVLVRKFAIQNLRWMTVSLLQDISVTVTSRRYKAQNDQPLRPNEREISRTSGLNFWPNFKLSPVLGHRAVTACVVTSCSAPRLPDFSVGLC